MSTTQTQVQSQSSNSQNPQSTTTLRGESPEPLASDASPATTSAPTASKPTTSATSAKPSDDTDVEIYDEIEIEDMTYDSTLRIYHYPCPCGDRFEILVSELREGNDIAVCPGCSLTIRVIYEPEDLMQEDG